MRADAKKNYDHLLAVARAVVKEQGADASLRDIARQADVGLGTLYRHFPTREALLEALLRTTLDEMTAQAADLEASNAPDDALVTWLREAVAFTHQYRGVTELMTAALDDPESALHASCVTVRAAGARLLARAQAEGKARSDIDGTELFALIAALAWLSDQPAFGRHAPRLFEIVASAILPDRPDTEGRTPRRPKTRS
ncbi:TetR/AcrR family transcriptional regulator [Corallococcus macrosporus]|uniref:TetR/AcrR family transcriptional regulator n=1 Tax=Corallococcus macrosporus TaxID=35 RepID=A0ABS3D9K4_9BACT|nr:TetR/AcrR family transcriptional regulator [Corallococcus macrosporus]MBN8228348.1 TetR/AcrR family transcriptional regulator [Corallococcus macrosporus]